MGTLLLAFTTSPGLRTDLGELAASLAGFADSLPAYRSARLAPVEALRRE